MYAFLLLFACRYKSMALKDKLLVFLANSPDTLYSGEMLAARFQVTRAAVWKAVRQLQDEGFEIGVSGGKGYSFSGRNDFLQDTLIHEYAGDASFPLHVLDTVDSTNNEARRMVLNGAADGTYIAANTQTAGRGRSGKSFYSPANTGLYVSYIMRTGESVEQLQKLTMAAAVAVCRALRECTDCDPKIKWVNDIYLGRRKVAGILTEAITDFETMRTDAVIIGIGINCRTREFPEELQETAGSLNDPALSRNKLAGRLYTYLVKCIAERNDPEILEAYREASFLPGRKISFLHNNKTLQGTAVSVNDRGGLQIVLDTGEEMTVSSGEVSILSWDQ